MAAPGYHGRVLSYPRLTGLRSYGVPGPSDRFVHTPISLPGLPIARPIQGYGRLPGNIIWQSPSWLDEDGIKRVNFAVRFGQARTDVGYVLQSITANGRLVYGGKVEWGEQELIASGDVVNGEAERGAFIGWRESSFWPPHIYYRHPEAMIRIYDGVTNEAVDSLILADKGAGNVPATYADGIIYAVFGNWPVDEYGGSIPAMVGLFGPADSGAGITNGHTWLAYYEHQNPGYAAEGIGAPAILTRDGAHAVGPSNYQVDPDTFDPLPGRFSIGVQERSILQTRQMNEWIPASVVEQGVEQAAPIGTVPGPVTYWPSALLWPLGWPMALDERDRAYFLEVFEGQAWQEAGWRGPAIGAPEPACNQGRWEKSRTKFRFVRVDPWTGGRLAETPLFRSPTTGDEYWWTPDGCASVLAPDQGRSAIEQVQMMTTAERLDGSSWLYGLFVSYPEGDDTLHTYWREPQTDISTPPPFTGPTGPYTDPGAVTHAPGSGRTDVRSALVAYPLPALAGPTTIDLGALGMIPAGMFRGPDGTLFVVGATDARRHFTAAPTRELAVAWIDGAGVRSLATTDQVPVTDTGEYDDGLYPQGGDPSYSSTPLIFHLDDVGDTSPDNSGAVAVTTSMQVNDAANGGAWAYDAAFKKFGAASIRFTRGSGNISGAYVNVSDNAAFTLGSSDFTIEGWFALATIPAAGTTTTNYTLACHWRDGTSDRAWHIRVTSNSIRARGFAGALLAELIGTWTPDTNAWHHYALTRQGTTARLFLDGVKLAEATWSGSINNSAQNIRLGMGNELTFHMPLDGWLDEFRMTVGVARYTADFTPPTAAFIDFGNVDPPTSLTQIDRTAKILPMSGFYDATERALFLFGNGRLMWPDFYQLAYPRLPQLTGTVYKLSWPSLEVLGTVDRIPAQQFSQLYRGATNGKILVRGDHHEWQQQSDGSFVNSTIVGAPTKHIKFHEITLSNLSADTRDLRYALQGMLFGTPNVVLKGDANDFLYRADSRAFTFVA